MHAFSWNNQCVLRQLAQREGDDGCELQGCHVEAEWNHLPPGCRLGWLLTNLSTYLSINQSIYLVSSLRVHANPTNSNSSPIYSSTVSGIWFHHISSSFWCKHQSHEIWSKQFGSVGIFWSFIDQHLVYHSGGSASTESRKSKWCCCEKKCRVPSFGRIPFCRRMGCQTSNSQRRMESLKAVLLFGAGFDKLMMDGTTVSGDLEVPEGILASWKWVSCRVVKMIGYGSSPYPVLNHNHCRFGYMGQFHRYSHSFSIAIDFQSTDPPSVAVLVVRSVFPKRFWDGVHYYWWSHTHLRLK